MDPHSILIIVALLCELGAAGIGLFVAESAPRFNLMALGFFFFFLSLLIVHPL